MNTKLKGYEIDYSTKTIYMNYKFSAASSQWGTEENKLVHRMMKEIPDLKFVTRSGRKKTTCNVNKRMTYENMGRYIRVQDNADELMAAFEIAKEESKKEKSPYAFVNAWFKKQFPDYSECKLLKLENEKNVILTMPAQAEKIDA